MHGESRLITNHRHFAAPPRGDRNVENREGLGPTLACNSRIYKLDHGGVA